MCIFIYFEEGEVKYFETTVTFFNCSQWLIKACRARMSNSFHVEFATFTTLHFDLPFLSVYRNETGQMK